MSLIIWKPEYSVHEPTLDSHHQKLFGILNTLYESVMNSSDVDCVPSLFDELSEYTMYHFSAEEQYMEEKGFRGIDDHISKHREFSQKIEKLKTQYRSHDLEVTRELIIVLGEWLLHHVIKEDRKYAEMSAA